MAARQTCPECSHRHDYCLPLRTQGVCDPCDKGYEPTPGTYTTSTAAALHRLAA